MARANLASRSGIRKGTLSRRSSSSISSFARLLADPSAGGVRWDRDVLRRGQRRERDQHIVAPKPDGFHGKEAGRQDAFRPGSEEGTPARLNCIAVPAADRL